MGYRQSGDVRAKRRLPPPNYLSGATQRRMLTLVAMLIMVLILMNLARQPDRWTWLWKLSGSTPVAASVSAPIPSHPASDEIRVETTASANSRTESSPEARLPAEVLNSVRDNRHFRRAEQSAWFAVWQVLKDSTEAQLESTSLGDVSYLQIYRQTDAYRGRAVTLTGVVRRAHRIQAPENDVGIQDYWQCWLFPEDGPREPIVVYALHVPVELNEGMTMNRPARLTGIVYKRWRYAAHDTLKIAPVVLAKNISLISQTTAASDKPRKSLGIHPMLAVVTTGAAALLVVILLFRLSSNPSRSDDGRQPPLAAIDWADIHVPTGPNDESGTHDNDTETPKFRPESGSTS